MTDTPTATDDKPDELTRLRDAVKTLRDSVKAGLVAFQRDPDVRFAACWLGAEQKMKAALATTANLVED